jgi:CcmD family protein
MKSSRCSKRRAPDDPEEDGNSVMNPLAYVGAAYAFIWVLLLVYAWRLTATVRRLTTKVDSLERSANAR